MSTDFSETDFSETYRGKSNDELLRLVREKDSLQEAARRALDLEMEKRGLGADAAARFEKQQREEAMRALEIPIAQKQSRGNWMLNIVECSLIFGTAAVLTVMVAASVFKFPYEAVRRLTEISLKAALALAFLIGAFGSRWITLKRIVVSAVILSVALFGFIVWLDGTASRH
jgi:hypothetical protein